MSEKRFVQLGDTHIKDTLTGEEWYAPCETSLLATLNEQEDKIHKLSIKWRVLSQENEQLKNYIDTIFEGNTHICKELDIEDVQFYCERNKDYRNPSCLYKKCFNSSFLVELSEKIKELFDDEPFNFNSNQSKLYNIKSISPNGVVRLGNGHKAEWRMKDVREISQELPPFEDFNRETLHEIRKKIGAKFDKDVLGRIIYNIYQETFRDYI